jgi:hypothetical protein
MSDGPESGEEMVDGYEPTAQRRTAPKRQRALVDNAGDAEQVADAKRREKDTALRVRDAIERLANTQDGQTFFTHMVEEAGIYRVSFDSDAMQMAFREGRRDFGLWFVAQWLLGRPDAMAVLLQQRALEEKRNG